MEGSQPGDRVALIKSEMAAMTFEEKQQLAKDMQGGAGEDFPSA
jgi:hypothetical protein